MSEGLEESPPPMADITESLFISTQKRPFSISGGHQEEECSKETLIVVDPSFFLTTKDVVGRGDIVAGAYKLSAVFGPEDT